MSLNQIVPDRSGFTASNGLKVFPSPGPNGRSMRVEYPTYPDDPDATRFVAGFAAEAIREYVRAEEDERLGRFRFTDDDGDVSLVYPDPLDENSFVVVVERSGRSVRIGRNAPAHECWRKPLDAYLAAHPEPKPWHDATTGEFWELWLNESTVRVKAVAGTKDAMYGFHAEQGRFYQANDPTISHAIRIWPEDAS